MTAATSPRTRSRRKWIFIAVATVTLLPVIVFAIWAGATLGFSYSSGERAGYIQKMSHKGWLCKTYEGELAMQNMPGSAPEIFAFSVRDKAVVAEIDKLSGQKVSLIYEQHKGVPTQCFGETEYYVTGVRKVGP